MNLEGRMLGQYQIVKKVGAGGMAVVYQARQSALDRDVAVKVLSAHHNLSPGLKERFSREAKAVAQLNHPNILPIYDVGMDDELSYFVMQYVASEYTLNHLLGTPLNMESISYYIDQIAGALDHAHSQGILHRDVKPSNILVDGDWLLLTDFGLAKIVSGHKDLTGSGMIMGTPLYVSPEQAAGGEIDLRSDVYSLGIILYQMVTGRVPFDADTPMSIMFKHVYEPLPPPRKFNSHLPKEIEHVVSKALEKDPNDRYQKAGDLAHALRSQIYPVSGRTLQTVLIRPAKLFISYQLDLEPDATLGRHLQKSMIETGHQVFTDQGSGDGDGRLKAIDDQIKNSDFHIVLLSKSSAHSEMVQAEVQRALAHRKRHGRPFILPVRVDYDELLPYAIDESLDPLQYVSWTQKSDTERVVREILDAVEGRLPQKSRIIRRPPPTTISLSEDGGEVVGKSSIHPPLPEFDPRVIDTLEAPGGVVKLRDKFYLERPADTALKREIIRPGTTTTIRAARQMGKSSLLVRGLQHAKRNGSRVVNLDLQRVDEQVLASLDTFCRYVAEFMVRKLRLDLAEVEGAWQGSLGPQDKLTYFMEDYILPEIDAPIALALDEVDRLLLTPFHTSFFALLRSWHNSRAMDEVWDNLNMVLVISTEPYLLIDDVNQSPFNVGLKLMLDDFDEAQLHDLNKRHGSPVTEADFPELTSLLGGHPYLTRRALYDLVTDHTPWTDLTEVAALDQGPFGDHLRRHHWLLRDEPELKAALQEIIQHNQCTNHIALFRLLQAGLIKGSGDYYACRCDLYRIYFEDKLL